MIVKRKSRKMNKYKIVKKRKALSKSQLIVKLSMKSQFNLAPLSKPILRVRSLRRTKRRKIRKEIRKFRSKKEVMLIYMQLN